MRSSISLGVMALLTLTGHVSQVRGDDAEKFTIQFLGEDDKPIKDCHFGLIDFSGERQIDRIRDRKLSGDARVTLDSLPKRFVLTAWNNEEFYCQSWIGFAPIPDRRTPPHPNELLLHQGENIVRLELTGRVSLMFSAMGKGIQNPLGFDYYRKSADGEYEHAGGIGVFLATGTPFEIPGLVPGEYRIVLRRNLGLEDPATEDGLRSLHQYWKIQGVKVEKKQVTYLKDLVAEMPPAIIAHRGASHDAPENTLAAIRLGFEQGADFVEVDLRLTADKQIVLMHDGDTQRTAGVGKKVSEQTLAELKGLDAGSFKGAKWKDERIPTLAEALAAIPAGKGMLLELKAGPEIVPPLIEVLKKSRLDPKQVVIIAFDFAAVAEVKRRVPEVQALWLVRFKKNDNGSGWTPTAEKIIEQARGKVDGLDLKAGPAVDAALMKQAAAAGLSVHVWTVNDVEVARQMKELGVSGITTDRPEVLREALEK